MKKACNEKSCNEKSYLVHNVICFFLIARFSKRTLWNKNSFLHQLRWSGKVAGPGSPDPDFEWKLTHSIIHHLFSHFHFHIFFFKILHGLGHLFNVHLFIYFRHRCCCFGHWLSHFLICMHHLSRNFEHFRLNYMYGIKYTDLRMTHIIWVTIVHSGFSNPFLGLRLNWTHLCSSSICSCLLISQLDKLLGQNFASIFIAHFCGFLDLGFEFLFLLKYFVTFENYARTYKRYV